jgi:hypothetical protein
VQPARATTITEQQQLLSSDGFKILRDLVLTSRVGAAMARPLTMDEDRYAVAISEIEEAGFELEPRGDDAHRLRLIDGEAAIAARYTPLELSIDKLANRIEDVLAIDVRETEWGVAVSRALEQAVDTIGHFSAQADQLHRDLAITRLELAEHRVNPTVSKDDVYEVQRNGDRHTIVKNGQEIGYAPDPQAAADFVTRKNPAPLKAWIAEVQQYDRHEELRWIRREIAYGANERDARTHLEVQFPASVGYVIHRLQEQEPSAPQRSGRLTLVPAQAEPANETQVGNGIGATW